MSCTSGHGTAFLAAGQTHKSNGPYKDHILKGVQWLIQHQQPDDFILATGKTASVRTFTTLAFREIGIELQWEGSGIDERGIDPSTGTILVEVSPEFFRPAEVDLLIGNPQKAKEKLGWVHKTTLEELVREMVAQDLKGQ